MIYRSNVEQFRATFIALSALAAISGSAWGGAPGTVLSHAKISDTAGGFTGTLDDGDYFGFSVATLGDLDGDGVGDLAVGVIFDDDDEGNPPGENTGAVWVLFLNPGGTVKAYQKISAEHGNFTGDVDPEDKFGTSVAALGDLDGLGPSVLALAVGAHEDDDGGNDHGAVWILFLNADGTVESHQKISDGVGGFPGGVLVDKNEFGDSVVALGDMDGDGVGDLAVGAKDDALPPDEGPGSVWVLFLNTDGTVKAYQQIGDGIGGFGGTLEDDDGFGDSLAALGDLDGDDVGDLAVGAHTDGTVKAYQQISNGTGGLPFGTLEDGDRFGISLSALGDLDGDGVGDLAVGAVWDDDGGLDQGAVWVLFLDADGTVKTHQKISDTEGGFIGTLADEDLFGISVAPMGDMDGDGVGDLAIGASGDDDGGSDHGAVWVLFLDGVPHIDFDPPQEFPAAGAANREATGDLDSDGDTDVVIAIPGDPLANGDIQVFLNLGNDVDGTWLGLDPDDTVVEVGKDPSSVAVGSFNRTEDFDLDVAVTNAGDDTVTVLFNAGDGTFPTSSLIDVGGQPSAVITADFDLDTFPDLAVANEGDNNVWIFSGDGTGVFGDPDDTISTGGMAPLALDPEDIDYDKDPDIVGINQAYAARRGVRAQSGSVFVLRNQAGVLELVDNYPVGNNPVDVATGDLDRDGFPDIAAVNFDDDTVSLLVNQGDGTFALGLTLPTGDQPLSVEIVDLDSDLDADLAVVATDPDIGPAVQVFRNVGQAVGELIFDGPEAFGVDAEPKYVVNADFNNDTLNDLVTVNDDDGPTGGSVTVLLNSPATPACPWDIDGNGEVTNVSDVLTLLAWWGGDPGGPPDFNNDGTVNVVDFLILLAHWGPCP
jgi:hypothetical protein